MQAVILSGGGDYSDPWHPFAETSERVAEILRAEGFDVSVREDVEEAAAELAGVDLIVSNAASGPDSDKREAARAGILAFLNRGGGVIALHVGASGLARIPEWEQVTGMAWVEGSGHPPVGQSHIIAFPERHSIAAGLQDFELVDERYSRLRVADDVSPFAAHELDGVVHPLVWAREFGDARIVVDTLGHDARSFDSAAHRAIITRGARWATKQPLQ
ncbi:ThuA domain-containing protein [Gryllotalpicola reticulitermitis]|uniref:ThuA domain-containing protein n=1 Tax=Gryllotalpicola reticulitermitis TaxID=1184153 RepID=A0ABV8Q4A2_9MICO